MEAREERPCVCDQAPSRGASPQVSPLCWAQERAVWGPVWAKEGPQANAHLAAARPGPPLRTIHHP